jgi:hypothetical protein
LLSAIVKAARWPAEERTVIQEGRNRPPVCDTLGTPVLSRCLFGGQLGRHRALHARWSALALGICRQLVDSAASNSVSPAKAGLSSPWL